MPQADPPRTAAQDAPAPTADMARLFTRLPLTTRANLSIALIFLLLLIATVVTVSLSLRELTQQITQAHMERELRFVQEQWQQTLRGLMQDTRLLAVHPEIGRAALRQQSSSTQYFLGSGTLSTQFRDLELVALDDQTKLIDLSFRNDIQHLLETQERLAAVHSNVQLGQEQAMIMTGDQQLVLVAALPVRDRATGRVVAVLYTTRLLDQQFLLNIYPANATTDLFLIADGAVVVSTRDAESSDPAITAAVLAAALPRSQSLTPTLIESEMVLDGVPHAVATVPLLINGEAQAILVIVSGLDSLIVFQNQIARQLLITFGLLTILGIVLMSLFMIQFVISPLNAIQRVADAIAAGDYRQRIRLSSAPEIRQLGHAFNLMTDSLEQLHTQQEQLIQQRTMQLQAALRDVEQARSRFDLAVRGSHDGIWDIDLNTGEAYLSPRWKEMLGYRDDEIGNTIDSVYDLIHPLDRDRSFLVAEEYLKQRSPSYVIEQRMRCKDGSYRWILSRGIAMRDVRGNAYRLAGSNTDITPLKEAIANAEQARASAEQANRMKSQFLANMSHELRTPLNSIINFTRILSSGLRGAVTPEQVDYLERVRLSGEHLLGLINDILDLSKIEAGHMNLHPAAIPIDVLIKSTLSTTSGLIKGKPITLTSEIEPNLPIVHVDRTRIRQVLLNLLSNAAKFTDEGSITVRACRRGNDVSISIQDTGIGIPADKHALIFEEFRQVEEDSGRTYQGTGLGLAISKRIIEMHGGTITVDSTPGIGSTFTFTVPIAPSKTAPELDPSVQVVLDDPPAPTRPIILAIDDDRAMIEILQSYLQAEGFLVVGVTDSRKAVDEARRIKPMLIMLDILMSYRDGWEVLAELKHSNDLRHIPVVICSILDNHRIGVPPNASAYLVKPIDRDHLHTTVRQLVAQHARILVVDDDRDVRKSLAFYLGEVHGYIVDLAEDGATALDLLHNLTPDLIILDLMLPTLDGFEVLATLETYPHLRHTPVIILTARDVTNAEREYLAQRTRTIVQKASSDPVTLLNHIRMALGQPPVTRATTITVT